MAKLDLDALDDFAAVARARSFRAAAALRGVSPSTLSQSLRDLETRLGVRLLNRTTRSVAMTEAGARLLERLGPALAEIASAVEQVHASAGEAAGTLRINAPDPAIQFVLGPMVPAFLEAHPKVRLEIVGETQFVDIVESGYDAGVRWGESLARDMIAVPLGPPQRFVVVAAPQLLARCGTPAHPKDLLAHPCIRQRFPSGRMPNWEFGCDGEEIEIDPHGPLVSTNPQLQREAAIAGVGFWSTFEDYVRDDLAAGRLATVLDDWCPSFPGPFLYYPSRRQPPPPLRAFVEFVKRRRRRAA